MARLGDIASVTAGQSAPQENVFSSIGIPFVRAGSLEALIDGKPENELELISEDNAKRFKLKLQCPGTVVFAKSGMSCMKGYVYTLKHPCYVVSHLACVLPNDLNSNYLAYYFSRHKPNELVKDAAYPSISLSDICDINIDIPSKEKQEKIVSNLDRITSLISIRKQQLTKLDELVKSRFIEMFGDPVLNKKEWMARPLSELSDIVSGITKGRKTNGAELFEVPYMAVSNVKAGYIDWTTVKTIEATNAEIERYQLQSLDVLMTEGGDPDKLGRGAIIYDPPDNCIHQNHIFRVRVDMSKLRAEYLEEYLQHPKAKKYFLGCAKQTTGIASINRKQLCALPILLPDISLQALFATFVAQVDKSKFEIQKSLDKLEILKKALMQKYFE